MNLEIMLAAALTTASLAGFSIIQQIGGTL